jgi:hypothetical protein
MRHRWKTYGSLLDLAGSGLSGTEDESGDFDCWSCSSGAEDDDLIMAYCYGVWEGTRQS